MRSLLILAATAAAMAQPVEYRIQPREGSRFALEVYKTGVLSGKKHLFLFERYAGTLHYDAKSPEASRVDLAIEAASFVLKDDWVSQKDAVKVREEAEKKMLDTARFKELRFVSSSVTRRSDGGFDVAGNLSIRNQPKPVVVAVTLSTEPGGSLKVTGKAEVKLRDYGLKPPGAAFGLVGTKNEMLVDFVVFATR